MYIYRPVRGGLLEAYAERKEFETKEDMFAHIVKLYNGMFDIEDIIIQDDEEEDSRIGWKDARSVCTKRSGNKNYMEMYGCPQCVGHCATDYIKTIERFRIEED